MPVLIALCLTLLPLICHKPDVSITNAIVELLYLFLFLPIQMGSYFLHLSYEDYSILPYLIIISIAQCFFFFITQGNNKTESFTDNNEPPLQDKTFFCILLITAFIMLYVLTGVRFSLSFNTLAEASSARFDQNRVVSTGAWGTGYLVCWLSAFFLPTILVFGLYTKGKIYIALSLIGTIILYGINTMKIELFIPFFIVSQYIILNNEKIRLYRIQINAIALALIITILIPIESIAAVLDIKSIILQRTLAQPGLLFSEYINFFKDNPYTYYSHINVINLLFNYYPYGDYSIGQMVHGGDSNSCAGFFAFDGIAAGGIWGLVFICFVFSLYLLVLKAIDNKHLHSLRKKSFFILITLPSTIALCNSSFFTYLLSRGIFLIIFLIFLDNSLKKSKPELSQGNQV